MEMVVLDSCADNIIGRFQEVGAQILAESVGWMFIMVKCRSTECKLPVRRQAMWLSGVLGFSLTFDGDQMEMGRPPKKRQ